MLESVIAYLQSADPTTIYLFLFLFAFLKNFFPVVPLDLPVALTGYLLVYTDLSIVLAILWPSLGSTLGFMVIYMISRKFGLKLYAKDITTIPPRWGERIHRFFPPAEMEIIRQRFSAHGYLAVLVNRFLLGSRSFISPVTGLMHLNVVLVSIAAGLSAIVWNMLLVYGGYVLGKHWQNIGEFVVLYTIPVSVLFFLIMVFAVLQYRKERQNRQQQVNH
ncbi:MAG: DedA family protein [Chlorobiaceae bacterium]|nr:DedA family protein [Chlorobiaceae bacterium]